MEYAHKAVENSGTSVGICCTDGVVFAVEKLVQSKLYEHGCNKRIVHIDTHIGMAFSGLLADALHLVEIARDEARNYRETYGSPIPTRIMADRVGNYVHLHTLYGGLRPFGCSVMLGGYDEIDGPKLFMIDPSGVCLGYRGCAVGKAKQAAKTEIEKIKISEKSCAELIQDAAKIIYGVHDEVKDKNFELELSWVTKATGGKHEVVSGSVFAEAEKVAKAALEDSDSDEDM